MVFNKYAVIAKHLVNIYQLNKKMKIILFKYNINNIKLSEMCKNNKILEFSAMKLNQFNDKKETTTSKIANTLSIINLTCDRIEKEPETNPKLQEMLKKLRSSFTKYNHYIDACKRGIALYKLINKKISTLNITFDEITNTISKVIQNEGKENETTWLIRKDGSIYRIIIKCLPYDSETYAYNIDESPQYVLEQKRSILDTDACIVIMKTPNLIDEECHFSPITGKVVYDKLYCYRCFVKKEITGVNVDKKIWEAGYVETWFKDEEMTQMCQTPNKFPSTE